MLNSISHRPRVLAPTITPTYRMGKDPHPSKVGFAANPSRTRAILDETGGLAPTRALMPYGRLPGAERTAIGLDRSGESPGQRAGCGSSP